MSFGFHTTSVQSMFVSKNRFICFKAAFVFSKFVVTLQTPNVVQYYNISYALKMCDGVLCVDFRLVSHLTDVNQAQLQPIPEMVSENVSRGE